MHYARETLPLPDASVDAVFTRSGVPEHGDVMWLFLCTPRVRLQQRLRIGRLQPGPGGTRPECSLPGGICAVIAVAVLLLPALGVLLYAMDRLEDRLSARPPTARHARGRHLRLVHNADPAATERSAAEPSARRRDAA